MPIDPTPRTYTIASEEPVVRAAANDDLVTLAELAKWSLRDAAEVAGDPFAQEVIWGVSLLIRDAGDPLWEHATLPPRAKLIAILKAKHFYTNPDVLTQESTGPLQESRATAIDGRDLGVVHNMTLTEEEESILARLANKADPHTATSGLWVQPTGLGEPEVQQVVYRADESGSDWYMPIATIDDPLYSSLDETQI